MYKRNVDLANKNKLLSLLHQLYTIANRTLRIETLSAQLIQTIVQTMDFPFVGLLVRDEQDTALIPIAGYVKEDPQIQLFDPTKHLSRVSQKGARFILTAKKTKNRVDSKQSHAYLRPLVFGQYQDFFLDQKGVMTRYLPLISEKHVIGVLCISFGTSPQEITRFERDAITNLVSIISIVLDKALIYEELKAQFAAAGA